MTVDFIQIQMFFIKFSSIECVSISSKFRMSFVIIKSGDSFAKLLFIDCELISPKFGGVAKFTSPNVDLG